jgi:hypothetical protein
LEGFIIQHEHLTGERIILILRPQGDVAAPSSPAEVVRDLTTAWKLDSTRKGNWLLVLLQETRNGKIQAAYGLGVGLSRAQVTHSVDIEELKDSLNELNHQPDWDQQAQVAVRWALQALSSPLLERPEQLTELASGSPSARQVGVAQNSVGSTNWTALFIGLGVGMAMILTAFTIIQGVRPEVLMGTRRTVRLSAQDQLILFAKSAWYQVRPPRTPAQVQDSLICVHSQESCK